MAEKPKGEAIAGCLIVVWSLFVTTPMWLVLLFAVMQSAGVPTWAWSLYWCYVPSCIIGIAISAAFKVLED